MNRELTVFNCGSRVNWLLVPQRQPLLTLFVDGYFAGRLSHSQADSNDNHREVVTTLAVAVGALTDA